MSGRQFIGNLDPVFNPFDETYLAEILNAVMAAWLRMNQPDGREIEDRITFRLAGRLANDPLFADLPYEVTCQHWLLGLNGERIGRLDLRFKHRHSQRDYFAFEAKRLHVRYPGGKFSSEYTTYTGDEGMMAFVEGQYAKGFPACGMLGYIMDGDSDKAWNGLDQCIEGRRTLLKLAAGPQFITSALMVTVPTGLEAARLGETAHNLEPALLRLFHLLLPVSSQPSVN